MQHVAKGKPKRQVILNDEMVSKRHESLKIYEEAQSRNPGGSLKRKLQQSLTKVEMHAMDGGEAF